MATMSEQMQWYQQAYGPLPTQHEGPSNYVHIPDPTLGNQTAFDVHAQVPPPPNQQSPNPPPPPQPFELEVAPVKGGQAEATGSAPAQEDAVLKKLEKFDTFMKQM